MSRLQLVPINPMWQRVTTTVLLLAIATLLLLMATAFANPVEAGTTCTGWQDTGQCCDSWWPGKQDVRKRVCQYCWGPGQCSPPWTEYTCATVSLCP